MHWMVPWQDIKVLMDHMVIFLISRALPFILKKIQFAIGIALKVTIRNNFFVKKICQKNLTTKLVKKIVKKKIENRLFFTKNFKEWLS